MDQSTRDKSGFEHSRTASLKLENVSLTPEQSEAFYEELRRNRRARLPNISGEFFLHAKKYAIAGGCQRVAKPRQRRKQHAP